MEVNITKRIVTQNWDRYCAVVLNSNGRIKQDWVVVDGNQEKHPEGAYYLEWREKGRRRRLSVGKDPTVAFNSQVRKTKELEARAQGLVVEDPEEDPNRVHLRVPWLGKDDEDVSGADTVQDLADLHEELIEKRQRAVTCSTC